ncbi:MAG TPA: hypothetical protein VFO85_21835, partial [Vicinamibacteria bacterium]|nr:hypothetical protein [Vicinamibacteria bacterium]
PGFRDTNQDGTYTPEERQASEDRNDTLTGVMIHQGAADHPQSAGCLNMSSSDYSQFVEAFGGKNQPGRMVVLDAEGAWRTFSVSDR